jgi:hypothetical protein
VARRVLTQLDLRLGEAFGRFMGLMLRCLSGNAESRLQADAISSTKGMPEMRSIQLYVYLLVESVRFTFQAGCKETRRGDAGLFFIVQE